MDTEVRGEKKNRNYAGFLFVCLSVLWRKQRGSLNKDRPFDYVLSVYHCVLLHVDNCTWCFLFFSHLVLRYSLPVAFTHYPQHMLSWVSFSWMNAYCFRVVQFTHVKSHCDLLQHEYLLCLLRAGGKQMHLICWKKWSRSPPACEYMLPVSPS